MSRILHITEGLVLFGRPVAEADKFYFILTKELGLVRAVARGVRYTKSKLRYSLTDNSLGLFTLVRGREIWHLAGAESQGVFSPVDNRYNLSLIKRIGDFVRRFVPPEEMDSQIYEDVKQAFVLTRESKTNLSSLETLLFFRILVRLGYIKVDTKFSKFTSDNITDQDLGEFARLSPEAIRIINQAMTGSHL